MRSRGVMAAGVRGLLAWDGVRGSPEYRQNFSAMAHVDVLIVDEHARLNETLGAAVRAVAPKARVHYAFELRGALDTAKKLDVESLGLPDHG